MTALQQSPQFARALIAYGSDLASRAPVVLQRRLGPFGWLRFASRLAPQAAAQAGVHLLNGESPCPRPYRAAGYRQIVTAAHVAEWDITQQDLRRGLHGKWRNRLVRAESSGLRITERPWDGQPHPMFDHADAMARRRRYRVYPRGLLAAYAHQNPNDAILFEAHHQDTLIAACLILRHGATATYQTAFATALGKALQAPRLVLFAAAQQMSTLGHHVLDLGHVETDHAAGLARFKLGTGAQLRPLGGTWLRLK